MPSAPEVVAAYLATIYRLHPDQLSPGVALITSAVLPTEIASETEAERRYGWFSAR